MRKKIKLVTVLSTYSTDRILENNNNLVRVQKGGPLFYLLDVFQKEKIKFDIRAAEPMEVDILINENGEFGRIKKKPIPLKIDFNKIKSQFVLISTILDEIELGGISKFKGKAFLDVQGYVRDGKNFGKKKRWKPKKEIYSSLYCVKGTEEELKCVPSEFLSDQKKKILIITKGKQGSDVFMENKKYSINPKNIVRTKNTIGAGDTFFAYFASAFMQGRNVTNSINFATNKTASFLANLKNLRR